MNGPDVGKAWLMTLESICIMISQATPNGENTSRPLFVKDGETGDAVESLSTRREDRMETFTKYLQQLGTYSEGIDKRTVNDNDFAEYQKLGHALSEDRNNGSLSNEKYLALGSVYFALEEGFRAVLGLNTPTPWEVYTMQKWRADGSFKALPGQEITRDIYDSVFNCLPPKRLPAQFDQKIYARYAVTIGAGFLMGEPHSTDTATGKELYLAFGKGSTDGKPRYYYLGLSTE